MSQLGPDDQIRLQIFKESLRNLRTHSQNITKEDSAAFEDIIAIVDKQVEDGWPFKQVLETLLEVVEDEMRLRGIPL